MNAALLSVRTLCAGYGGLAVLRDISLEVREGELVAVLGPNGAGKSTLLRAISRVEATIASGTLTFEGRDLKRLGPEAVVRAGLVQVPEGRELFSELTVDDNLRLGGFVRPAAERDARAAELYERFPALAARRSATAFSLSGGEQQMLAIARALMARPKLLLLDEPSTGLAPQIVTRIFEIVADLRAGGTAVLLVEQNAHLALQYADRAYVVENGSVALQGTGAALAQDERVRTIYLGGAVALRQSQGDNAPCQ
ncbi:MAG: ABC transporter ATP-binding protein [Candidatus Baltobacteraceae bacterium]|jgi:ABC-type branched-subunit amino acid transport system ATPase component